MHEFYANFSDNILIQREPQFEKVFVRGHIYEFSPSALYEYLNITIPEDFDFEKDYVLDDIATEILGYKCVWPKANVLRVTDLTLKSNGLHKMTLRNWFTTKYVTTLFHDFATLFYDIGTGAPMHLGQVFFWSDC